MSLSDKQIALLQIRARLMRRCVPELCETVSAGRTIFPEGLQPSEFDEAISILETIEDDEEV